jgi:uncharacterized protein (DUF1684 family)
MIPHGLTLAFALLAAAPAHRAAAAHAAAPDTFETAALADRDDTVRYFHENAMSPLATILRQDFAPDGGWITIGAAADNAVVLADSSVSAHHLRVKVEGEGFRAEVVDTAARFDAKGAPTAAASLPPGTIGVGRYKVRLSYQNAPAVIVFDPRKPLTATFKGPTYWPYDKRYRFLLPLEREARADTVFVESTHGQPRAALRVGRFTLALPGRTVKLAAYRLLEPGVGAEDLGLFFMDATCGKGSYHGGRYVDAAKQPDGRWLVDLNRAYNPSCAYSPHYNCPIPPHENRLTVGIPVGESWPEDPR